MKFFKFPNFSPVIANQYLFIFVKLEEDNICLFYNFPFVQTCCYVLASLASVKLALVYNGQVCRYHFNEFNDKDNLVLFNFRQSEKRRKGNYRNPFL